MKKWVIFVCLALFASTGLAGASENMMGLYFDTQANENCLEGVGHFVMVPMHLILTHPTGEVLLGFEFGIDMVGEGMVQGYTTIAGDDLTMQPWDNFAAGMAVPYPVAEVTVLATFDIFYTDLMTGPLTFTLHGYVPSSLNPDYPALIFGDGILREATLSTGTGPSCQINGLCSVVGIPGISFDALKSLYR